MNIITVKWLDWIPFFVLAISFHVYFLKFSSSPLAVVEEAKSSIYIYSRYLVYFFILSLLLTQALSKTTGLNKRYLTLLSVIIVSVPLLTFRNLVIAPFDYIELTNTFCEIGFIILGFYLFYLLNLINKKLFKISFKNEDWTALLIITSLLVLLWEFQLDTVPFRGDGLERISAGMNPSANTWNYWSHIFTTPTHGPQYRPISFFAIFYFFRNIFGPVIWPFQYLCIILSILSGKLFFNLIREISRNYLIALIGACYLVCNFAVIDMMTDVSNVVKYFFPLAFLTFGLLLIKRELHKKLSYTIAIFFLSIVSMMCHEGSFVFPIVFILFDFALYKKARKLHFLLIAPTFVYFFFRLFYFGVPNEGFMEVNLLTAKEYLPKYMDRVLAPQDFVNFISAVEWLPHFSICFFAVILFVCIFFINKKHYLTISSLFLSVIIILAPFSVLINHFYRSRALWAIVPTVLLISFIAGNIQKKKIKFLFCGIFLYIFLISEYSNIIQIKKQQKLNYLHVETQKNLKLSIAKQLKQGVPAVIYINSTEAFRWEIKLFSSFLSINFPTETFIIQHSNGIFLIKNGTYFIQINHNRWKDPFRYESKEDLPEKALTIYINPEMLKSLRSVERFFSL